MGKPQCKASTFCIPRKTLQTKAKAEAEAIGGEDEITKAYYERMICVGGW